MSLVPGLQLPFGIQPVNAVLVDSYAGPYDSVAEALSSIPSSLRVQTRFVHIVDSGIGKLYWFKDGTADGNLVQFSTTEGYVPYTGSTQSLNMGEYGVTSGFYGYDLTPTGTPTGAGTSYWSAADETVALVMDANVTQKIGQDSFYLVKNQTGSTIPKGTVVRAAGTVGASGRILVEPFLANGTYPSKTCIGVTTEAIADGADGFVTAFGKIRGVDTSAYSNGTILYASPTTAGGFTATVPQAPNNIVTVAIVVYADNTNGELLVRPTFGSSLNEDEAVRITTPATNQGLFYDGSYWVNKTIAQALGYTPANAATAITALTGEATASGPGAASVTLSTAAVTGKILSGVNITGGSINDTDSILTAFGKLQNQINGLMGGAIFQSTWNASTNTPTLTSSVGTKGYYYIVSVAGSTNLNGITDWQVGDWAIFDGTAWRKVDNTDAVVSVNGFTGAVSLTTSNIPEGTGLYYTDARARLSLSAGAGISYNNSTGLISSTITQYTDSLARAALSFAAGSGAYNSSTGVITIPTNTNQLTNGAGFITGINSSMVTTALGYTPYNSSNPNGYISGITSGMVTTALGYTPYNSSNPAGYITSSALSSYLPLSGGTLTGSVAISAENSFLSIDASGNSRLGFTKKAGAQPYLTFASDPFVIAYSSGSNISASNTFTPYFTIATSGATTITSDGGNQQLTIRRASNNNNQLILGYHSGGYSTIQSVNQGTAYTPLILQPDGSSVGIGTNAPTAGLHVYNSTQYSTSVSIARFDAGVSWGGNGGRITFSTGGTDIAQIGYSNDNGNTSEGTMYFFTKNPSSVMTEKMRIGPTGSTSLTGVNNVFSASAVSSAGSMQTQTLASFWGLYNNGSNGHSLAVSSTAETGLWEFNLSKSFGGSLSFGVSEGTSRARALQFTSSTATFNVPVTVSSSVTLGGTLYLPNSISGRTSQIEFANSNSADLLGMPNSNSTFYLSYGVDKIVFRNDGTGEIIAFNSNRQVNIATNLFVGGIVRGSSYFGAYTTDGLFNAQAIYSGIATPNGDTRIRFGYLDQGGGQYWGRIGFSGATNWSMGTSEGGNSFDIRVGNSLNDLPALSINNANQIAIWGSQSNSLLNVRARSNSVDDAIGITFGTTVYDKGRIVVVNSNGGNADATMRFLVGGSPTTTDVSERMRIDGGAESVTIWSTARSTMDKFALELYSGNTGTATNNLSIRFHQAGQYYHQIRANVNGFQFTNGVTSDGVNISAAAGSFSSSVTASTFFKSSDARLKEIIGVGVLNADISELRAKLYLKNGVMEYGYIAQEAQKFMDFAVSTREDGYLDLDYTQILTAKVERLEAEVKKLNNVIRELSR